MPSLIGRIFTLDRAHWSPENHKLVSLPAGFEGHMVLVVGWASQWDWVRIVTVASSARSTKDYVDYLPIYPTRKNQYAGMGQLRLCNDWYVGTVFNKRSYVKTNSVGEVPLDLLQPAFADSNGLQFQLRMESEIKVINRVARWKRHAAAEREAAEGEAAKATLNRVAQLEQDLDDFSIAVIPAHGRLEWDTIEAVCATGDEYVQLSPRDAGGVIEA